MPADHTSDPTRGGGAMPTGWVHHKLKVTRHQLRWGIEPRLKQKLTHTHQKLDTHAHTDNYSPEPASGWRLKKKNSNSP